MGLIRRFWGAITTSTRIAATIALLAVLVCLLDSDKMDLAWWVNLAIAILATVAVFVGVKDGLAAQDAADGPGRQRRAATAMAASAATKTIEIGNCLVPRVLSDEQMSRLTDRLRSVPGQRISVPYTANETEIAALAEQFIQAFRDAGWVVRPSAVLDAVEMRTGGGFFFDPARVNKNTLASVASAFSAAGCRIEPRALSIEGAPFVLRIFSK